MDLLHGTNEPAQTPKLRGPTRCLLPLPRHMQTSRPVLNRCHYLPTPLGPISVSQTRDIALLGEGDGNGGRLPKRINGEACPTIPQRSAAARPHPPTSGGFLQGRRKCGKVKWINHSRWAGVMTQAPGILGQTLHYPSRMLTL